MGSVDKIKWAMSLRDPQYEALQFFVQSVPRLSIELVQKLKQRK